MALGVTRLSVIDLPTGHQPIHNEDASIVVVFNGEIYNYRDLRSILLARGHTFATVSDTEVLVHLYEDQKESMLAFLDGMFALAIYDRGTRSVFLARDRFGNKPFYYQRFVDGIAFSSELEGLRPLARRRGVYWRISQQAVSDYLSLGVVPQPQAIFEDVYAIRAGSWLQVGLGGCESATYWSPEFEPKLDITFPEAVEETRCLIAESVRRRMRSDVPLGVFLSGGVDSSVIAYEAAQLAGSELQAFTVSTGGMLDETSTARETAAKLDIRHTVLPLNIDPSRGSIWSSTPTISRSPTRARSVASRLRNSRVAM